MTDAVNTPPQTDTELLAATPLLDHGAATIQQLITERGWRDLTPHERIGAIYHYVQNEIRFGYNTNDDIPASHVLADGYGQCNTKATLLMALLRAVEIPCRFHAATIDKRLQRGVVPAAFYPLAPTEILHSWVEVRVDHRWRRLEGVILDENYLDGLRCQLGQPSGALLGYAVGTNDIQQPDIDWNGGHTEIQMTGVERDLGIHNDPDTYYRTAGTNLSGVKAILYRYVIRHLMNRTVTTIRNSRTL